MNDAAFDVAYSAAPAESARPPESLPGERAWNGLSAAIALLGAAIAAWCLTLV
jgi:hypothetical protein